MKITFEMKIRIEILLLAFQCSFIQGQLGFYPRSCFHSVQQSIDTQQLVDSWNHSLTMSMNSAQESVWNWSSDMNDNTQSEMNRNVAALNSFKYRIWQFLPCLNCSNCSIVTRKRLDYYKNIGTAALTSAYSQPIVSMLEIHSKAQVCNSTACLSYEPHLRNIMEKSRNYCELQWAWVGWRNSTGRQLKQHFNEHIQAETNAAFANGFLNAKFSWAHLFTTDDPTFFQQITTTWNQLRPLYQQLHAYVRKRLVSFYGNDKFSNSGHIPAHLLGNMWAQDWSSIYSIVEPYPEAETIDLTNVLKNQGYSEMGLFQAADMFFQSLGLEPMTFDFWNKSIFHRTPGKSMNCHASAWDFYGQSDFRIKMCSQVTAYDYLTAHHEMGHIQYYMNYRNQPFELRQGANPGFHETIGDIFSLSADTPNHLKVLGLISPDYQEDEQMLINRLLKSALNKVAFLPFSFVMEKYRWDIFTGDIIPSEFNSKWWEYRCGIQGVSSPVMRSERDDFDAGSKHHIASGNQYIM